MQLRDYQQLAVDTVFEYFQHNKTGNPVIAMPTGTGKSLVIAGLIEQVLKQWPSQRFMVLTHVKELVEQNSEKLRQYWDMAPIGVYSSGLRKRDIAMPVIFGGCGSVVNRVKEFGHRDILIIDECHLVSPKSDTTYQTIIAELQEINPKLRVIGLSATAFRLGQGMITDGGIFSDICCDMTTIEWFNWFFDNKFLSMPIPRRTAVEIDTSKVTLNRGEFAAGQLEAAANDDALTRKALAEMCEVGADRESWLIFAAGTAHAERVTEMLQDEFGVTATCVHSKITNKERDDRLARFKQGEIQCVVNNNVLTTGFDHPPIDLIGMLRPTMSPGLWVQMLGRGTRPSPDTQKENCLVLDFAGNTRRLGPINDPAIPKKRRGGGDAPTRICDTCGTYNHASARVCVFCETEFEFDTSIKLEGTSSTEELVKTDLPLIEEYQVDQVLYYLHEAKHKAPCIRVSYHVSGDMLRFDEWVHIEGRGVSSKRARDWWRARFPGNHVPATTAEALQLITHLRVPSTIRVHVNRQYPEVVGYGYEATTNNNHA